jgi:hypothetical protein
MKMETVIRSPQKGVIAKLVHKEGVRLLLSSNKNCPNGFHRTYVRRELFSCYLRKYVSNLDSMREVLVELI